MSSYLGFVFKSSLRDFARNKVRTFLTSLGILIGVLSVVLLVAIGVGLQNFIQDQFDSLGANTLIIFPGQVLDDEGNFGGSSADDAIGLTFTEQDYERLRRIREIELIAPIFTSGGTASYQQEEEFGTIVYTNGELFPARNFTAAYGRVFTEQDNDKRAKVVVLGYAIAEELFGDPSRGPGRDIVVNDQTFQVIGVMEEIGGGGFGGPSFDTFMIMPYKTGFLITGRREFVNMFVRPRSEEITARTIARIEEAMLENYDEDEFSVTEQTEILEAVSTIFATVNAVLVAISAISLLVGGIGIMNIMYVTVTERIKEIGIRRAIGARKIDILSQFIMESVILSVFGGAMAVLLAYGLVYVIQFYFPAAINLQAVLLALGVSTAIGVIFGVFPAKKAADLSPIEAIRSD